MFARKFRVPVREFLASHPPTAVRTPWFSVRSKKTAHGYNRVGVIAGIKAHPTAVGRHALKRTVREALRAWPNLSRDVLVVLSPAARDIPRGALREALGKIPAQFNR